MATKEALRAHAKIRGLINCGKLIRPNECELCGYKCLSSPRYWSYRIIAHHYLGYNHPIDIWWICHRCNCSLRGRHDGSLTQEEARLFVASFSYYQGVNRGEPIPFLIYDPE